MMGGSLQWDDYYGCYYLDIGYFRIDYIYSDYECSYTYCIYFDGNEVLSSAPLSGEWTLDEAYDSSIGDIEEMQKDLNKFLKELNKVDRGWMESVSENTHDLDDFEEEDDY